MLALSAALLLVLAPLVGVALHEDHEGPACPVCKLAGQPSIELPAGAAVQPPVVESLVVVVPGASPLRDALLGDRPSRAPPA